MNHPTWMGSFHYHDCFPFLIDRLYSALKEISIFTFSIITIKTRHSYIESKKTFLTMKLTYEQQKSTLLPIQCSNTNLLSTTEPWLIGKCLQLGLEKTSRISDHSYRLESLENVLLFHSNKKRRKNHWGSFLIKNQNWLAIRNSMLKKFY